MGAPHGSVDERYARYVEVRGEDECWPWLASTDRKGYGQLRSDLLPNGKRTRYTATRVGWRIHFGTDPGEQHVLHTCDNPPCQNPKHWFLGTNTDNIADKVTKGRGVNPVMHGADNPATVLTSEQIAAIRSAARYHGSGVDLAHKYGVSESTISRVRRARS